MKKLTIIVLMLISTMAFTQARQTKKNIAVNKICLERGHIGYDSIPMHAKSVSYIWDVRDTIFRITPSRIKYQIKCERCGEIYFHKPKVKREILKFKENGKWVESNG